MTSSTVEVGRSMPVWFKSGIATAFVLAACWGSAIWYWRTTDSTPAMSDLMLVLLALPSGLLLALWLGKKAIASHGAIAATTAASPAAVQAATTARSTPPLAILATALRSPHGSSAEELAALIATNKAQPDLDKQLVDDEGFPLTCARRDDADDEVLQEEVLEWQSRNGLPESLFGEAQWRALILGTAVMRDLAWHAMSELGSAEGSAPQLHLIPLLSVDWTVEQRSAAQMWFQHIATQAGFPSKDVTGMNGSLGLEESALPKMLDRFALDACTTDARLAAIVIACGSSIDQTTVDEWAEKGRLFTPSQPQGFVPGEGAAGLLLTELRQAKSIDGAVYTVLEPTVEAKRDPSHRSSKPAGAGFLDELAARALKCASVDVTDIGMVVGDASYRGQCMHELMGFTATTMPHLDSTADVASVGPGCGSCGAVPFVTALALAWHYALERGKPVLYMSNDDPELGHAVLVRPAASEI
ncbi:MAG: hypothetical protein AB1584_15405 [Pseudomonadota bacterium]